MTVIFAHTDRADDCNTAEEVNITIIFLCQEKHKEKPSLTI